MLIFRDLFNLDTSMFYTVNRYPNNRKLYLINYHDFEGLYAVGIIGLHYNEYVDGFKTWTLSWACCLSFSGRYNWSVEMEKVGHKMENSSDFAKNFPF